ncbi:MAG: STAS/SEC14 domain-containing protein [Chloroflexota bacterium]|jgi:hypothetical protein
MIEKMEQSSGNVLGYKVAGTVTKSDYDVLTPEVESVVEQEGDVSLLLDMTEFKWEKVSAWGRDMKFGKRFHEQVSKMAIVGDKRWEKWLADVASPFYAQEAQYFASDERDAAWDWLREED